MFISGAHYIQVAWVVEDLEQAIHHWVETARVGPFFLTAHVQTEGLLYRGRPTDVDFSLAIAQAGSLQIELIQQHDQLPSVYREGNSRGESRFHHVACFAKDFDLELAFMRERGIETVASGKFGDMRFLYADTRSTLGCMTEVLENTPMIHRRFDQVADASKGWDGRDPIRDLTQLR